MLSLRELSCSFVASCMSLRYVGLGGLPFVEGCLASTPFRRPSGSNMSGLVRVGDGRLGSGLSAKDAVCAAMVICSTAEAVTQSRFV